VYINVVVDVDNKLNCVKVINKPCMRSRCMSLLPRTTLHSDSEQPYCYPPTIIFSSYPPLFIQISKYHQNIQRLCSYINYPSVIQQSWSTYPTLILKLQWLPACIQLSTNERPIIYKLFSNYPSATLKYCNLLTTFQLSAGYLSAVHQFSFNYLSSIFQL
jgi:hypothetical protein